MQHMHVWAVWESFVALSTPFFVSQSQGHQGPQTWLHIRGEGWWGSCCCNQDGQHPGRRPSRFSTPNPRSKDPKPVPMLAHKQPKWWDFDFELFLTVPPWRGEVPNSQYLFVLEITTSTTLCSNITIKSMLTWKFERWNKRENTQKEIWSKKTHISQISNKILVS